MHAGPYKANAKRRTSLTPSCQNAWITDERKSLKTFPSNPPPSRCRGLLLQLLRRIQQIASLGSHLINFLLCLKCLKCELSWPRLYGFQTLTINWFPNQISGAIYVSWNNLSWLHKPSGVRTIHTSIWRRNKSLEIHKKPSLRKLRKIFILGGILFQVLVWLKEDK